MSAADPEYIAFACPAQLLLDIANPVDGITGNPLKWYSAAIARAIMRVASLVWLQNRHRGARMRLPGDPDRRSIPSEDTARDR